MSGRLVVSAVPRCVSVCLSVAVCCTVSGVGSKAPCRWVWRDGLRQTSDPWPAISGSWDTSATTATTNGKAKRTSRLGTRSMDGRHSMANVMICTVQSINHCISTVYMDYLLTVKITIYVDRWSLYLEVWYKHWRPFFYHLYGLRCSHEGALIVTHPINTCLFSCLRRFLSPLHYSDLFQICWIYINSKLLCYDLATLLW